MGVSLAQVLRRLGAIYRFPGQQAPDLVDTGAPVTLFHDVSREAELGTGGNGDVYGGHFSVFVQNVHGASGEISTAIKPYEEAISRFPGLTVDNQWVWFLGAGVRFTGTFGNFNFASVVAEMTGAPAAYPDGFLSALLHYDNADALGLLGSNAEFAMTAAGGPPELIRLPFFVPEDRLERGTSSGGEIRFTTQAGGALTYRADLFFWTGARGMTPPGMY